MSKWKAWDEGDDTIFDAADEKEAARKAEEWIRDYYDPGTFVDPEQGSLVFECKFGQLDDDGEVIEETEDWARVVVDPNPPKTDCGRDDDDHDWHDGEAYATGGAGVGWSETCAACGLVKHVNTHEVNREDGSTYRAISYTRPESDITSE